MFHRTKRFAAVVLTASVIAALTACSAGSSSDSAASFPEHADSITVAQPADLKTPDPVIDNGLLSLNIFHAVFDQLTEVDGTGALQPRLATEWTASEDAKTWSFTLNSAATFSDGSPVTADDVIFSFQTVIDTSTSLNHIYTNNIESMSSTGAGNVTFTLKSGDANFTRIVYYISIVPKAVYTALGAEGFAKAPIGSGPYTFVSWTPGVSTVLKKNPDAWGAKGTITDITVVPVADSEARVNGLLSGSIDLTAIAPSQVDTVKNAGSGYAEVSAASNQVVYLGMNTLTGPLANVDLRAAISMGIDRATLIDTLLGGNGTVATAASVTPDVNGYDDSLEPLPFDVDKAKALVASSGYDGSPIEFDYQTDGNVPMTNEMAQSIAAQLADIGVNVTLTGGDIASFTLLWTSKKLAGLYLYQFSPSMMDAATTLNYLYGPTGYALFSDPDIDRLIVEAGTTVDPEARKAVIAKIWAINAEKNYIANVDYSTGTYGLAAQLDWTPRSDGQVDFRTAAWK
ncbi:ABC transporter substrate-binding protein [Subtercola boreus]|uniref:Solute-binding protein family 5 domain-containing protein n=1 Tax=Subtercola boreus TaxID=120213 RepID=A0A3E0W820_9MICO|nr:ABC transporter substrate-binding protein [Subtercola boreus]RFA19276.1 hypothetical protein B7R24_11490 [Subtercola boreus]RFA19536.1 hypothetical protein B7R23_11470 [Subtercola boreus]RFA25902.1 hypothetical protein B7R25_11590 [Subtercola boreus]